MAEGEGGGVMELVRRGVEDGQIMAELPLNEAQGGRIGDGDRESESIGIGHANVVGKVNVMGIQMFFGSVPTVVDVEAGSNGGGRGRGIGIGIGIGKEDVENHEHQRLASGGRQRRWQQGRHRGASMQKQYANGVVNGSGSGSGSGSGKGVEEVGTEVVHKRRRDRKVRRNGSIEEIATTKDLSDNVSAIGDERSLTAGDTSAVNVEAAGCELPSVVDRGEGRVISGQEGNGSGSLPVEARTDEMENRPVMPGSVGNDSDGSQSVDVESSQVEPGSEGEAREVVSQLQELPQLSPPVLSSADERSITLSWVGCSNAASYYLDAACKEVVTISKKGQNSAPPSSSGESDLNWTSVYCGEQTTYKVDQLKPGTSYSCRIRAVPRAVPPLVAPPSPPPSDISVFSTLPAAPSAPSPPILVNRARTSLKVKWAAPSETGGLSVDYIVEMNPAPGKGDSTVDYPSTYNGFVRVDRRKMTDYKATRLLPGTVYRFRVLAANSVGQSSYSEESSYTTDASVPAAPAAPTLVHALASSMTVEWQEPNNSGSPVTDYTLERDDGEGGPFVSVYTGPQRQCTMEGLKSGHIYRVRVMAHNDKGKGAFSVPAEYLTGFTTPDPPPTPSVVGRSTTSGVISYCRPERDGGSPITAFELEMKQDMAVGWNLRYYGSDTTFTLDRLSPGTRIRVRVRAVNLMGKSGWSGEARFETLPAPPEAPSAPTALEFGSSTLKMGWRPPAHDGGSSIVCFRLEMRAVYQTGVERAEHAEQEGSVTVYRCNDCRYVVEGLNPGATYSARVQAINKLGAGPYSESSMVNTPCAPPTTPEPPQFVGASANGLSLRWHPSENNGAPIQRYTLQMLVLGYGEKVLCGCDDRVTAGEVVLQGDSFTKPLEFTTSTGPRAHSDSSSPFSDGVPHSPSHSTSSDSSRGTSTGESEKYAQKNRRAPSYAGTSEDEREALGMPDKGSVDRPTTSSQSDNIPLKIIGDHLYDVYNGPSTSFTIKKLQPFTSYAFRVQARNEAGLSGFSAFAVFMTSSAAPCAPCAPTVVETTSSSVNLRWEVPEHDNGSHVYRYSLQMLRVLSDAENFLLKEKNTAILNGRKKASNKKLNKQETLNLIAAHQSSWDQVYDGSALGFTLSDLLPGHQYSFRLVVHNGLGVSPPSSSVVVTTSSSVPGVPPKPRIKSTHITPTSAHIKWSPPACDNGMPITSYKLLIDDGRGGRLRKVYEGGATSHRATKLVPASCYRVAVQAINALGASALSEVEDFKTPLPAPPTPKVELLSESSLSVNWLNPLKEHDSSQMAADSAHYFEGIANVLSYTLEMDGEKEPVYEGSSTRFEEPDLGAEQTYRFRVRAHAPGVESSSWSGWSTPTIAIRRASMVNTIANRPLKEEFAKIANTFIQRTRQLQQPWSTQTRRLISVVGVSVTLVATLHSAMI